MLSKKKAVGSQDPASPHRTTQFAVHLAGDFFYCALFRDMLKFRRRSATAKAVVLGTTLARYKSAL